MLKTGYGRVVNIASISGKDGNAGMLAYSSSKAAVINLTKVMGPLGVIDRKHWQAHEARTTPRSARRTFTWSHVTAP